MCRALADGGGRRCAGHADVHRNRSASRAQWVLRASKVDAEHPVDLTRKFDQDDDDLPTIGESRRAVQLSPRLQAQLVALRPALVLREQQRTQTRDKMFEAERTLERAHTSGTPGDINKAAVLLGRAELADQASARRLAAWAQSNGFLSTASMHASLALVAAAKGVPALG